jgi:hypothetical protein
VPSPKEGYFVKGEKVPSVTTVLGRFKESGGLMQWAFQQGRTGAANLYEQRHAAADIGTVAHSMVEAHIHKRSHPGRPADMSAEDYAKAEGAFNAYLTWERHSRLQIFATEVSLTSERHCYGGTIDAIGDIDGVLCLPDWKTSNATYSDFLVQIAAYGALWEENNPEQPLEGGFHLLRFAKTEGDFHHHHFPRLAEGIEMFLCLRRAYDLDKQLKKRAA